MPCVIVWHGGNAANVRLPREEGPVAVTYFRPEKHDDVGYFLTHAAEKRLHAAQLSLSPQIRDLELPGRLHYGSYPVGEWREGAS
jgi:hypothetical protein